MSSRTLRLGLAAAVVSALAAVSARADIIQTTLGAKNGAEDLLAHVDVTFGDGTITMSLSNDIVDVHSAAQLLVGVNFTLTTGQNAGTIASSSGTRLDVNDDDTFTLGTTGPIAGWGLTYVSGADAHFALTDSGNDYTVIGLPNGSTDLYSNANSSIHSHNPFLASPATFTLSVPGVTADTHIAAATLLVGTNYTGASTEVKTGVGAPEPTSMGLLLAVAVPALLRRRRRR